MPCLNCDNFFFSKKFCLKNFKIYFWNTIHWHNRINFQNVILVCTEENIQFLSTADAVFKMWQFRNYEFGIGENIFKHESLMFFHKIFIQKITTVQICLMLSFTAWFEGKKIAIKGQLISEWNFGVFKSPKQPTKLFPGFLP